MFKRLLRNNKYSKNLTIKFGKSNDKTPKETKVDEKKRFFHSTWTQR